MNKKVVSMCLAASLLGTSVVGASAARLNAKSFTDVKQNDWFYSYVDYVARKGYMVGMGEDKFAPDVVTTRAMFVTMLAALDNAKIDNKVNPFKDVLSGSWYAGSVQWAADKKIVAGVGDKMFDPDTGVTRQDMCVIINRFIEYYAEKKHKTYKKTAKDKDFLDEAEISSYAKDAVESCRAWGLVVGMPDGKFHPKAMSTRAEVATVMTQVAKMIIQETSGGGGGGGGGSSDDDPVTPPVEVAEYKLAANAELDGKSITMHGNTYKADDDKTLMAMIEDMLGDADNQTNIKDGVDAKLDSLKGTTKTMKLGDQNVKVTINEDGKISATVVVNVGSLGNGNGRARMMAKAGNAAPTQDELIALAEKLMNGEEITIQDQAALSELVNKSDEVANSWSDDQIQAELDKIAEDKPEYKDAVANMKVEDVKASAKDYNETVTEVQKVVEEKVEAVKQQIREEKNLSADAEVSMEDVLSHPTASEPIEEVKEVVKEQGGSIAMTVPYDLNSYMETMLDGQKKGYVLEYNEAEVDKILTDLALPTTEEVNDEEYTAAVQELYKVSTLDNFVVMNDDGTMAVKTGEEYANAVLAVSDKMTDAWDQLVKNNKVTEAFCKDYVNKLKSRGVAIEQEEALVAMLANVEDTLSDLTGTTTIKLSADSVLSLVGNITLPDAVKDVLELPVAMSLKFEKQEQVEA